MKVLAFYYLFLVTTQLHTNRSRICMVFYVYLKFLLTNKPQFLIFKLMRREKKRNLNGKTKRVLKKKN